MKTLRVSMLAGIAALAVTAAIAGPGIGYWNANSNPNKEQASVAAEPAPAATPVKCEKMPLTMGRTTKSVDCQGAVADTAACKAHCAGM